MKPPRGHVCVADSSGCLKPGRDAIVSRLERSEPPCMSEHADALGCAGDWLEWRGGIGGERGMAAMRAAATRLSDSHSSVSRAADGRRRGSASNGNGCPESVK